MNVKRSPNEREIKQIIQQKLNPYTGKSVKIRENELQFSLEMKHKIDQLLNFTMTTTKSTDNRSITSISNSSAKSKLSKKQKLNKTLKN